MEHHSSHVRGGLSTHSLSHATLYLTLPMPQPLYVAFGDSMGVPPDKS